MVLLVVWLFVRRSPSRTQPDDLKRPTIRSEVVDGYQQIYLINGQIEAQITHRQTNHTDPQMEGHYAVWVERIDGAGQIALYDLSQKKGHLITDSGTNLHPQLSANHVVWERWMKDRWQVFYYNGSNTRQLTSGDVAIKPIISGNFAAFIRQDSQLQWRVERIDLRTNELTVIKQSNTQPSIALDSQGVVTVK